MNTQSHVKIISDVLTEFVFQFSCMLILRENK